MVYPLIIDGVTAGKLTVTEEGLFTVFEATAPECGRLLRLSVYGGGKTGYLGVMQPWSEGLYLRRRLSKNERRRLPESIEYAAPAGELGSAADGKETVSEKAASEENTELPAQNIIGTENASNAAPDDIAGTAADTVSDEGELTWFARPDGTLTAFTGKHSVVALPAELRRNAPGAVLKRINGRIYMLFGY